MYDREKVINDLQDAVNDDWIWQHADYYALTMERAIALLKEQEPKPVKITKNAYDYPFYRCPNCERLFHDPWELHKKYCCECGQAVKWE